MIKKFFVILMLLLPCVASEANKVKSGVVDFQYYGSDLQVHFDASKRVKVKKNDNKQLAKCLEWLKSSTDKTLEECLKLKKEMNLSDWAYLKMLDKLSQASLGNSNEATAMMATLLCLSDYDAKLAWEGNKTLRMLYFPDANIFGATYLYLDNKFYYVYGSRDSVATTPVKSDMSGTKPISMKINSEQKFAVNLSEPRTIKSVKNKDFSFTFQVNKNLVDFYGDMPSFYYGDDFMTRWTSMANVPLEKRLQDTLVKEMKTKLAGLSQQEAVQQLDWWIQGGIDLEMKNPNQEKFLYAYDDAVWGADRPFYAEETLYYQYQDNEDRSILLSRLIRDVLGLKVLFVYYPDHAAIAVCFTDADVKGAYVVKDGMHFVICDPTYIGSNIGEEMPTMVGKEKTVRLLEN